MNKICLRKTREQWATVLDQQLQSELIILEFCQTHDFGFVSFGKWKRRLSSTDTQSRPSRAQPAFAAINVNSSHTQPLVARSAAIVTLNMGH